MEINKNLIVGLVEGGLIVGGLSATVAYYAGKKKAIKNYEKDFEESKERFRNSYSDWMIDLLKDNVYELYDLVGKQDVKINTQEKQIKDLESKTKSK